MPIHNSRLVLFLALALTLNVNTHPSWYFITLSICFRVFCVCQWCVGKEKD